ncbi:cysteine-rich protein 2-binding protein-like isoform X4 [Acropora muricata]|uniref:cysteine-rich protein 2-binding protein-like isoform X4 n=1 Tax=Acropora muricata TaxID=159855 RepID=UPI0034E5EC0C
MGEEVIDPGVETAYEEINELCYCNGEKASNMLQCSLCRKMFHFGCLKSGKPSLLAGDVFFDLTCASCSSDGEETCMRQSISWIQAVYLSLYNLYSTSRGRKGYFRWREDICQFIDRHWMVLFPKKKKTTTWPSTVAGILSSGCPRFFKSGQKEFNKETGWWALQENVAPEIKFNEIGISGYKRKRKGSRSPTFKTKANENVCKDHTAIEVKSLKSNGDQTAVAQSLSTLDNSFDDPIAQLLTAEDMLELADASAGCNTSPNYVSKIFDDLENDFSFFGDRESKEFEPILDNDETESVASTITSDTSSVKNLQSETLHAKIKSKPAKTTSTITQKRLILVSEDREKELLLRLNSCPRAVHHDPTARRFRRKLLLRQIKRTKGLHIFDLDDSVSKSVTTISQYHLTSEGIFPVEIPEVISDIAHKSKGQPSCLMQDSALVTSTKGNVLDRYLASPSMLLSLQPRACSFLARIIGGDSQTLHRPITSPYTSRTLKPFIRKDYESRPLKLQLLQEIVAFHHRKCSGWRPPPVAPIEYCYVQPHHIASVNAMCQEFFWPGIDLSECLQYPDFSCIVLYKKFIIGFAFMVPDVKYNEAYISFVLVHPEWRRGGIGTYMIYHLIQTCMGKDVTLHVSVTNPAMLLYQKFGFKPEEFILDFYSRYLPEDSSQCRHAYFLRLRR